MSTPTTCIIKVEMRWLLLLLGLVVGNGINEADITELMEHVQNIWMISEGRQHFLEEEGFAAKLLEANQQLEANGVPSCLLRFDESSTLAKEFWDKVLAAPWHGFDTTTLMDAAFEVVQAFGIQGAVLSAGYKLSRNTILATLPSIEGQFRNIFRVLKEIDFNINAVIDGLKDIHTCLNKFPETIRRMLTQERAFMDVIKGNAKLRMATKKLQVYWMDPTPEYRQAALQFCYKLDHLLDNYYYLATMTNLFEAFEGYFRESVVFTTYLVTYLTKAYGVHVQCVVLEHAANKPFVSVLSESQERQYNIIHHFKMQSAELENWFSAYLYNARIDLFLENEQIDYQIYSKLYQKRSCALPPSVLGINLPEWLTGEVFEETLTIEEQHFTIEPSDAKFVPFQAITSLQLWQYPGQYRIPCVIVLENTQHLLLFDKTIAKLQQKQQWRDRKLIQGYVYDKWLPGLTKYYIGTPQRVGDMADRVSNTYHLRARQTCVLVPETTNVISTESLDLPTWLDHYNIKHTIFLDDSLEETHEWVPFSLNERVILFKRKGYDF